jgi:hypothetical protein
MGLIIDIYRSADRTSDCTLGGLSSTATRLCLVNVEGPFNPSPGSPAAWLESHRNGIVRIVPAVFQYGAWAKGEAHYMMGGNYGATADSRMADACERLTGAQWYGAVAIHDRCEG